MPLVSLPTATLTPTGATGYPSLADLKLHCGISVNTDDSILTDALNAAIAWAESPLGAGMKLEVSSDSVRYFDAISVDEGGPILWGDTLMLDGPLAAVTSITVDNGATTLQNTDYVVKDRNKPPYYAIELKRSSSAQWSWASDPLEAIAITGRWGYAVVCPDDVRQALLQIAAFFYRQKDQSVANDQTVISTTGYVFDPSRIPSAPAKIVMNKRWAVAA